MLYFLDDKLECVYTGRYFLDDKLECVYTGRLTAPSQLKLAEYFPNWVFPKFLNPIKLKNKYYWFFCIKITKTTLVLNSSRSLSSPFLVACIWVDERYHTRKEVRGCGKYKLDTIYYCAPLFNGQD